MHTHDHHDHDHGHTHEHDDGHTHQDNNIHDNLMGSKEEAVAFLQYTLHHNEHHEEELGGLAHSLEHLQLLKEAQEVRLAIQDIGHANARLEYVLTSLK